MGDRRSARHPLLATIAVALLAGGCRPGGGAGSPLIIGSADGDGVRVSGELPYGAYAADAGGEPVFTVSDVPYEQLRDGTPDTAQVLYAALLWRPKPGQTPLDPTATNVSLEYIILSRGEMGVYGGGGFARPLGAPGDPELGIDIESSTLRLLRATPGFVNRLGNGRITGVLRAERQPALARRMRQAVEVLERRAFTGADPGGAGDD
jgi:hypothetical protein